MKEKPKNYIIKIAHRPHGNEDKRVVVSHDATGKRTVIQQKVDADIAASRAKYANESGYYNGEKRWQMVTKGEAEKLSHKDANRISGHLKRLGYSVFVENIAEKTNA